MLWNVRNKQNKFNNGPNKFKLTIMRDYSLLLEYGNFTNGVFYRKDIRFIKGFIKLFSFHSIDLRKVNSNNNKMLTTARKNRYLCGNCFTKNNDIMFAHKILQEHRDGSLQIYITHYDQYYNNKKSLYAESDDILLLNTTSLS
jgi:hypothetical protein